MALAQRAERPLENAAELPSFPACLCDFLLLLAERVERPLENAVKLPSFSVCLCAFLSLVFLPVVAGPRIGKAARKCFKTDVVFYLYVPVCLLAVAVPVCLYAAFPSSLAYRVGNPLEKGTKLPSFAMCPSAFLFNSAVTQREPALAQHCHHTTTTLVANTSIYSRRPSDADLETIVDQTVIHASKIRAADRRLECESRSRSRHGLNVPSITSPRSCRYYRHLLRSRCTQNWQRHYQPSSPPPSQPPTPG